MTDTTKHGKQRDLVVTRVFDAPVEHVWEAWTEPEHVRQWWGPEGFTCPLARMDVRAGGTSLVCMRVPKEYGDQDIYTTWTYRKIDPHTLIEFILCRPRRQEGRPCQAGYASGKPTRRTSCYYVQGGRRQ